MYLPKHGKWLSQHLHLKINSGFHARKNLKQRYVKIVTFGDPSFSKKRIYILRSCTLDKTLNRPSSAWESFDIRQKLGPFVLRVTHIISNLLLVCVKLTQVSVWVQYPGVKIWHMKYQFLLTSYLILTKNY